MGRYSRSSVKEKEAESEQFGSASLTDAIQSVNYELIPPWQLFIVASVREAISGSEHAQRWVKSIEFFLEARKRGFTPIEVGEMRRLVAGA